MNKQDLIPLVEKVAKSRRNLEEWKLSQSSAKEELEKTPQNKCLQEISAIVGQVSEDLTHAEEELKSASLTLYDETKEKKPIDKVEIKIYKRLEYDPTKILEWCKKNAQSLLIVNKKPFEKTAVGIGAPVEVTEEAKCTIGTDLTVYLKQTEEVKTSE